MEEVTKPQPRKKTEVSKVKNVVEEPALMIEELDQALTQFIEVLSSKWVEFEVKHLDVLTGVAQRIAELKALSEKNSNCRCSKQCPSRRAARY